MLIKASGLVVEQFPYSFSMLKKDNANISFPRKPSKRLLESFGAYEVIEITPDTNENERVVRSNTPVYQNNRWELVHTKEAIDPAVIAQRERSKKKAKRTSDVSKLTVTVTSGLVFDADEDSQSRMVRALKVAEITGQTTTQWTMADNSVEVVTVEEMEEALALSMQAMAAVWFI